MKLKEKDIVLSAGDLRRYWSKVNKNGPMPDQAKEHYHGLGRCWEWTAGCFTLGYGAFSVKHEIFKAYRIAILIDTGKAPTGKVVMHRCDNPGCVNPDHLTLGTHKDNSQDRQRKGRGNAARGDYHYSRREPSLVRRGSNHYAHLTPEKVRKGEKHPNAKLTDDMVRQIHHVRNTEGLSHKKLAALFGVYPTVVQRVLARKIWKHVELQKGGNQRNPVGGKHK